MSTHENEEDKGELVKLESELEKTVSAAEAAEPRVTDPVVSIIIIGMESAILMML